MRQSGNGISSLGVRPDFQGHEGIQLCWKGLPHPERV